MTTLQGKFHKKFSQFTLDVNFEIPNHGFTALYGRSGSGKSSLLRCIAGLEQAKGFLKLNQHTWQDDEKKIFVPTHQRKLGFVSQHPSLFSHLNVKKNILFGYEQTKPVERKLHPDEVIAMTGIEHLLERKTTKLSGGEIQRVAIARALLTSPELLLLDEPLSALDYISKKEVLPDLRAIQKQLNLPILYVSHDLPEVVKLCEWMILMESGRVADHGALGDVIERNFKEDHPSIDTHLGSRSRRES